MKNSNLLHSVCEFLDKLEKRRQSRNFLWGMMVSILIIVALFSAIILSALSNGAEILHALAKVM